MINAIVLAGGKSSRFGSDKAQMQVGGVRVLDLLAMLLLPLVDEIIVVSSFLDPAPGAPFRVVRDLVSEAGPIGGIFSGLSASTADRNFVVACDMPLIKPEMIGYLLSLLGQAVVPVVGGRREPLHAVYAKSCLPVFSSQVSAGNYKMQDLLKNLNVEYVEEPRLRQFDPELTSFLNINTRNDLVGVEDCLKK